MEVSAGEIFTGGAVAIGVDGAAVGGKFFVADIDSFVLVITFKQYCLFFIVTRPV